MVYIIFVDLSYIGAYRHMDRRSTDGGVCYICMDECDGLKCQKCNSMVCVECLHTAYKGDHLHLIYRCPYGHPFIDVHILLLMFGLVASIPIVIMGVLWYHGWYMSLMVVIVLYWSTIGAMIN